MPQHGRGAMAKDTVSRDGRRAPACPVCGRPRSAAARPFCSRRCADLDLGRWLTGVYAVPSEEGVADGDSDAE